MTTNTKNPADRIREFANYLLARGVKINEMKRFYFYCFDFEKTDYRDITPLNALCIAAKDMGAEVRTIRQGSLTNGKIVIHITDPAARVLDDIILAA